MDRTGPRPPDTGPRNPDSGTVTETETETVTESETVTGFTWSRWSSRTPDPGFRTPDRFGHGHGHGNGHGLDGTRDGCTDDPFFGEFPAKRGCK